MDEQEYDEYDVDDTHAKSRERKLKHRSIDKLMRGNRSVFTIKDTKQKRDKRLWEKARDYKSSDE